MPRKDWGRRAPVLSPTPGEARAMLRPALGEIEVAALEPLGGGHANTNIRVQMNDGSVVLRLYQRDPEQMRKEAALARLVAGRVPAPRYLHCGTGADGQVYAVVEWIAGAPLQARLRGASAEALAVAGAQIGAALAAIHGFTFEEADFLDGALRVTPFPGGASSAAYLETTFAGLAGARLGRALAREVVAFAKANEHLLAAWSAPPRLTHFDFGPSNILVREDFSLAAILDWEFAAAASPAPDFGNLLRPPLGRSGAFVEAVETSYRAAGGFLPDDWRALVRLADMSAWAEFLSRPDIGEAVIADARQTLSHTISARGETSN